MRACGPTAGLSASLLLPSFLALMANISHFLSVFLVITFRFVSGYVPASPTNVTTAIQAAMNLTSPSLLHLQWYSNGYITSDFRDLVILKSRECRSYWENVSYQLVAANSTGISQVSDISLVRSCFLMRALPKGCSCALL